MTKYSFRPETPKQTEIHYMLDKLELLVGAKKSVFEAFSSQRVRMEFHGTNSLVLGYIDFMFNWERDRWELFCQSGFLPNALLNVEGKAFVRQDGKMIDSLESLR